MQSLCFDMSSLLDKLLQEKSWKSAGITEKKMTLWLQWFFSAAQENSLHHNLLCLSKRVLSELKTTKAKNLAVKIREYTLSSFMHWDILPSELKFMILSKLTCSKKNTIQSGLQNIAFTSKEMHSLATAIKENWVNRERVSLETYGCKSARQASSYVISNPPLKGANLTVYKDLENPVLIELIEARKDLEYLCIWGQNLTSAAMNKIHELKNLKTLTILSCKGFEELNLQKIKELRSLTLQECENLKTIRFPQKTLLEKLHITQCPNLKITLPQKMLHLKKLTLNKFYQCSFPKFAPKLQAIFWSDQDSTKDFLCDSFPTLEKVYFVEMSRLESIKILNCPNLRQVIFPIQTAHLKEIELIACPAIESVICPSLPSLRTLRLPAFTNSLSIVDCSGCRSLKNLVLPKEAPPLSLKLRELTLANLDLSNSHYLKMLDISYGSISCIKFPTFMPYLEKLNFAWNEKIETVLLPKKNPRLKEINAESCPRLKKFYLTELPLLKKVNFSSCKSLKEIDLSGALNLEIALFNVCQSLKTLTLSNSSKIRQISCRRCSLLKNIDLSQQKSNLKKWDCSNCANLPDLDLTTAINIETINTSHCHQLATLSLPKEAHSLVSVNVLANLALTEVLLPQSAPNMQHFIYAACSKLIKLSLPLKAPRLVIQYGSGGYIKKGEIINSENYTNEQFCEFQLSDDARIQNFLKLQNIVHFRKKY